MLPRGSSDLGRLSIERQAYLLTRLQGVGFEQIADHNLDSAEPYLILPKRVCPTLAQWMLDWSQLPPRIQLFELAAAIMQTVAQLHSLGYVHQQLTSKHVLVSPTSNGFDPKIVGLSRCVPVGERATEADEEANEEACTSMDIRMAMPLLADLLGPSFVATPVASAMNAPNPADRPSARQVADLFLDLVTQAQGQPATFAGSNTADNRRAA